MEKIGFVWSHSFNHSSSGNPQCNLNLTIVDLVDELSKHFFL
jgi:hypothetical protein